MTKEEIEELMCRAEEEYDRLKDRVILLDIENKELKEKISELEHEIERLKKAKEDSEAYYQDNWKPITPSAMYGVSDKDFV